MVEIRDFSIVDTKYVIAIADVQLGEGYVTADDLDGKNVIVAEDIDGKRVVGFCIAYIDPVDGKAYVKTVAVAQKYSRRGVGTALVAKAVDYLKGLGAKQIFSPLWKHDDVINSDVIFRRNGFVPMREIPDYWLNDSIEKGYSCPVCGKVCHCVCVMYGVEG